MAWWQSFFDAEYLRLWGKFLTPERTAAEVSALCDMLDIRGNTRILDAPCGSGRLSRALAERGAIVLGVDQSAELIAEAERTRGNITVEHLRYMQHDLRNPVEEYDFDIALNIFSSLGYGDVIPQGALRALAGFEALNGLLLIGWTASFLFVEMQRFWIDGRTLVGEADREAAAGRSQGR